MPKGERLFTLLSRPWLFSSPSVNQNITLPTQVDTHASDHITAHLNPFHKIRDKSTHICTYKRDDHAAAPNTTSNPPDRSTPSSSVLFRRRGLACVGTYRRRKRCRHVACKINQASPAMHCEHVHTDTGTQIYKVHASHSQV